MFASASSANTVAHALLRAVSPLMATLVLLAQDAPATFKSSTNLVIINVTVRDKSGKPIDTLKKQDFQLLEDGKPQAISVFELQKLDSDVLPPASTPEKSLIRRDIAVTTPTA